MAEPVIGIDLGTTFSAVATVEAGRPRIIPTRAGHRLTPSMVGFTPAGERRVGEAARSLWEQSPESVAYATKRYVGRRYSEELAKEARATVPYALTGGPAGDVRIQLGGRVLPLTQVSAMILGELRLDAVAYFGRPVSKAVITVPANFDDGQRTATKEAARMAGLDVLRLLNEPTAAAVAYGLSAGFQGRALVFDLGGGTFDVSILEVENGVFHVKATGGDSHLGGEDFDNRIVEWLKAQVPDVLREAVSRDRASMQRLKAVAERAKRELTETEEALIEVDDLGDHAPGGRRTRLDTALTRAFFETLCEPLSRRCLDVCVRVMTEARLERTAIDALLLVGGMTRVPLVRRLAQEFFGREPSGGVNPDEVVALGAAVHAQEVSAKAGDALLIDVASHSLGVGVLGGGVRKLIAKNTSIPVVARHVFNPGRSGQTQARIPVYQGESDYADENTKLGELVLADLARGPRADVPIEVGFELSSEGTLSVRAVDLTTGMSEAIRIDARTALSAQEMDKLRREQAEYARKAAIRDAEARMDAFVKTLDRAEQLARVLAKSAEENPGPEAAEAVQRMQALLEQGRAALANRDAQQMAELSRSLARLTQARPDP